MKNYTPENRAEPLWLLKTEFLKDKLKGWNNTKEVNFNVDINTHEKYVYNI